MYVQITNRCNMSCLHCCFACTSKGEDMVERVWRAAIDMAQDHDETVCLGGGEPTLHNDFERIICYAMSKSPKLCHPFIVTNGTHKDRSRLLHGLTVGRMIQAHLSHDQYHDMDMVDDEIFELFRKDNLLWGPIGGPKRAASSISANGRGKKIKGSQKGTCACDTIFIKPSGNIHHCGCDGSPQIGDVFTGLYDGFDWPSDCYKMEMRELQEA